MNYDYNRMTGKEYTDNSVYQHLERLKNEKRKKERESDKEQINKKKT